MTEKAIGHSLILVYEFFIQILFGSLLLCFAYYFELLKRRFEIMKLLMWLLIIFGGGVGLFSTLYIVVSLFAVIGFKIFRKIKYGMSLYD